MARAFVLPGVFGPSFDWIFKHAITELYSGQGIGTEELHNIYIGFLKYDYGAKNK